VQVRYLVSGDREHPSSHSVRIHLPATSAGATAPFLSCLTSHIVPFLMSKRWQGHFVNHIELGWLLNPVLYCVAARASQLSWGRSLELDFRCWSWACGSSILPRNKARRIHRRCSTGCKTKVFMFVCGGVAIARKYGTAFCVILMIRGERHWYPKILQGGTGHADVPSRSPCILINADGDENLLNV